MTAIVKTNKTLTGNYASNEAFILLARRNDARGHVMDWNSYESIVWKKYQIKETDFRVKTATFTTPQYVDLTTGSFAVMITTPMHEDFMGVIISVSYDHKTGLYEYQCQDWSRNFQSKLDMVIETKNVYRVLQTLITSDAIPITGAVTKTQLKNFKKTLSGLRPAYQYYQHAFGSTFEFNPMLDQSKKIIRGKSYIEAIRDLIYGSGAYIDVYFNKYGTLQIEPYHKDDFFNTGLFLSNAEITNNVTQKFDTTNIITGTIVHNTDKSKWGTSYGASTLVGINLAAIFGVLTESIENPNQTNASSSSSSNKSSNTSKKSNTNTKTSNPYGTKKKVVWLNSDNVTGRSSDMKFLKDMAKLLNKNGWSTKIVGVGSHTHEEGYANVKNGIWLCVYGGIDAAVIREACIKSSYRNKLDRNKSRSVFCMRPPAASILKGGKYYKYLPRAWDDTYSPASFKGISKPLDWMTKYKVPIMYAKNAKKMVAKFLAGGDNPDAC